MRQQENPSVANTMTQNKTPKFIKLIEVHVSSACVAVGLAGLLMCVVMHEDLSHYPLGKPFCQQRQSQCVFLCVCLRMCTCTRPHLAPGTVFAR